METKNFLERALEGQNQWWKYLLIFLIALFGGQLIGLIPFFIVIIAKLIFTGGIEGFNFQNLSDLSELGLSKNLSFGLTMLAPLGTLIVTIILVQAMHGRTFAETVNGTKTVRWSRTFFAFATWFVLMAIYLGIDYFWHNDNYVFQLDWGKFAVLIVLSIVLVPFQTTSEELLMRGYLAQGIGAGTHSRWWALIIPSVIFGLLHILNPEIREFGFLLAMSQYLFFGILFGLIAILDDGIELSMGLHAANNMFLVLFVTHSASALQTDALFSVKAINPVLDLISLLIIGVIVFFIFYKKYNWNFKIMNQKVETAQINDY
ncbi:MAG: CPBP family intramembrane metalloprotease [Paludibacter sp.]|nr:CPBP family intramembrane metalloprotease [Paludibacter sp.]